MELNKTKIKVSIVLDMRRLVAGNKYPVRLRIYRHNPKLQKLYPTDFTFTKLEFDSIWLTIKPRENVKPTRKILQELEDRANQIIDGLVYFTIEEFEKQLLGHETKEVDKEQDRTVNHYFIQKIDYFLNREAISTSESYGYALKCLLRFAKKDVLEFEEIDVNFLEGFEKFCIKKEEKSITTVGIYTRNLRAVFNDAKIPPDKYPFGQRKYIIKSSKKVKKALDKDTLKLLLHGKPQNIEQQRAKDFWFFSFFCNGMNVKDILSLRVKDVGDEKLTFIRAKTASTRRLIEPIEVYLNEFSNNVISQYGNLNQSAKQYLFPFLRNDQSAKEKYDITKLFTRSINQNFLKYARSLGVSENVSTYYARHSFSTHLIRKGISMEAVGEALGHTNIKTTMHYFSGFEDESKKEVAKKLLDFD